MNLNNYSLLDQDYFVEGKCLNLSKNFSFKVAKQQSEYFEGAEVSFNAEADKLHIKFNGNEILHDNYSEDYVLKKFIYELSKLEDFDSYDVNGNDYQKDILDKAFDCEKSSNQTGDTLINFKCIFKYAIIKNIKCAKEATARRINSNQAYYDIRNKVLLNPNFYLCLKKEAEEKISWTSINTLAKLCTTPGNYIYFQTNKLRKLNMMYPSLSYNQYRGIGSYGGYSIEDKSDMTLQILKERLDILGFVTECETFEEFAKKFILNNSFIQDSIIKSLYNNSKNIYNYGKLRLDDFICLINNANIMIEMRNNEIKNKLEEH